MNKTSTILATLALGAITATAGTTPAPVVTGKSTGKTPIVNPVDPCPGGISYNNVELLYVYTDWDGGGSTDGASLRGSYALNQNLYLAGGINWTDGGGSDLLSYSLGVGAHMSLTSNIDAVLEAGLVYYDLDIADARIDDTDWGYYIRPHFRGKWGCLEAHLGAQYVEVDGDSGYTTGTTAVVRVPGWEVEEWSAFLDLYYHLNANWDITAGVSVSDDYNALRAGIRYRF